MILVDKNVGETPLQLLERVRREKPELAHETLSYAGRLDPMAEGLMLILVGEENKDRERFLHLDKEYIATFLIGMKTDTGDILGLIEGNGVTSAPDTAADVIAESDIKAAVEKISKIREQQYPWFSGKAVDGIKLFDHFKEGNTDIERPKLSVEIKEVALTYCGSRNIQDIEMYIISSIEKVVGDFRQKEILARWHEFFAKKTKEVKEKEQTKESDRSRAFQVFEIRILVSSGTFIRALTETFPFPATLLTLKRTHIQL